MTLPIAACIITRNEEARLPRCLDSLCGVAAETIVVDTGSTDQTRSIARARGAAVTDFPWSGDFSAARNASLDRARADWILIIDSDEELAPGQEALLGDLLSRADVYAYECFIKNSVLDGSAFVSRAVRLFRNDPRLRFSGRVHESIDRALLQLQMRPLPSEVTVLHSGYAVDAATNRAKAERNLQGLLLDVRDQPNDLFIRIKVGQLYVTLGQSAAALEHLAFAAKSTHPSLAAEALNNMADIFRQRGDFEAALAACKESLQRVMRQRMGYSVLSLILLEMGRTEEAAAQAAAARSFVGPTDLFNDLP